MNAVETENLTKTYRGEAPDDGRSWGDALVGMAKRAIRPPEAKTVVDRVSLEVREGELFGIVGSNGAGKTTFLKLLSCLVYPDDGRATVNGFDLRRQRSAVRRSVVIAKAGGWMSTLWQLNGRENLLFRARMCGLSAQEGERRASYVLQRLELEHQAGEHSWSWSAGELQRFSLGLCFIARTPVVMLDEPTSHLDPHVARLIREFISDDLIRDGGQTVLMSTHYLEEADQLCDRVAVFSHGRVLACDTPPALRARYAPDRVPELWVTGYRGSVGEEIRKDPNVAELIEHFEDVATGRARLRPTWTERPDPEALRSRLETHGVTVLEVREVEPTLDEVYVRLSRERVT
jgi:ABC-type multidrug transport system ATPase subunit